VEATKTSIISTRKVGMRIALASYLAKFLKDHLGLEELLRGGWNLSEAEAEYGPNFLLK
jgi:hypothetical protein